MAVNFCLFQYSPTVSCRQLSADDYEASNLISSNPQKLRRGYRAEHFINPPIEIFVRFPYCIDISHIVLGVRSGPQQVSAVKLFSDCPRLNGRKKWDFQFIGKCENVSARKVHFQNPQYIPREPFSKSVVNSGAFQETDVLRLPLRDDINISNIQKLKVCLMKVANSGVAILSELQVWGQPARSCDKITVEKIFNISCSQPSKTPVKENYVQSNIGNRSNETNDDDVPSEFLDSITHEIMALPMVLPSGNIVDQRTIEKWKSAQEVYGRTAVDPFTGVPFHGENQPVFNPSLKARIDEFLVRKGSSLNIPRSTGTRENIPHKMYKSSLYSDGTGSFKVVSQQNSQPTLGSSGQTRTKQTLDLKKEYTNKKMKCSDVTQVKIMDTFCNDGGQSTLSRDEMSLEKVCEAKRKESLKAALDDLLGTTRHFTNFPKAEKPQAAKCVVCSCEFAHTMFQLPCSHIMCRGCMTSKLKTSSSAACDSCNTAFSSDSVERIFL